MPFTKKSTSEPTPKSTPLARTRPTNVTGEGARQPPPLPKEPLKGEDESPNVNVEESPNVTGDVMGDRYPNDAASSMPQNNRADIELRARQAREVAKKVKHDAETGADHARELED